MITEEKFLEALDIVRKYQLQLSNGKTPIQEWVKTQKKNGVRGLNHTKLFNGLLWYSGHYKNDVSKKKFIEDMNWWEFRHIPNVGPKTWEAFLKLTEHGFTAVEPVSSEMISEPGKTPILEWVWEMNDWWNDSIEKKVLNSFRRYSQTTKNESKIKFIEDITHDDFKKMGGNLGPKSWNAFSEMIKRKAKKTLITT